MNKSPAEILGFGPIQSLLELDEYYRSHGKWPQEYLLLNETGRIVRAPITFEDDDHVMRVIERIVSSPWPAYR